LFFGLCLLSIGWAATPEDMRKIHYRLQQSVPDATCTSWLKGGGSAFLACFSSGNMTAPPSPSLNNSCTVNNTDFANFCQQPCYATVMSGLDYIVSSRVCYSFLSGYLKTGCSNDSDCGTGEACYASTCHSTCTTVQDCLNSTECDPNVDMCVQPKGASSKICYSNETYPNGKGTPQFESVVYSYKLLCAQSGSNYCGVYYENSALNITSLTCNDVSSWGCCTGSILNTLEFCLYETLNNPTLYTCPNSASVCPGLPSANSYCNSGVGTLKASLLAIVVLIFGSIWSM